MKRDVMDLMCDLDDVEVAERRLGDLVTEHDQIESEKKDAMKSFRERISECDQGMRRLSGVIRARREKRGVSVAIDFHVPMYGHKRITRLDTGEFVRDEPMDLVECAEYRQDAGQMDVGNTPEGESDEGRNIEG